MAIGAQAKRYGNTKRTAKQRMGDVDMFLAFARREQIMEATAEGLAARHGIKDVAAVREKLAAAQRRGENGNA